MVLASYNREEPRQAQITPKDEFAAQLAKVKDSKTLADAKQQATLLFTLANKQNNPEAVRVATLVLTVANKADRNIQEGTATEAKAMAQFKQDVTKIYNSSIKNPSGSAFFSDLKAEFEKSVARIQNDLALLDKYATFDDPEGIRSLVTDINNSYTKITGMITRDNSNLKSAAYDPDYTLDSLEKAIVGKVELSSYFGECLTDKLDTQKLISKAEELINCLMDMHALDEKMNTYALKGTLDQNDRADITDLSAKLGNYKQALPYLCAIRFGNNGEGLAAAYSVFGITSQKTAPEDKFIEIANAFADNAQKVSLYALHAASRYSQAFEQLMAKPTGEEAKSKPDRDLFDFFSRLEFYKAAKEMEMPGNISDAQLQIMINTAKNMPPFTAGVLFGSGKLYTLLSEIPDPETRLAVFKQGATLIKNAYLQVGLGEGAIRQNFEVASKLVESFGNIAAEGNLATELKSSNFQGTEQGTIALRFPWQRITDYYMQTVSSALQTFAYSTIRPNGLFGWSVTQDIALRQWMPLLPTRLKETFDMAHAERNRYLLTMPSPQSTMEFRYTPNQLKMMADYGKIVVKMSEAYSGVLAKGIKAGKTTYASGILQGSGADAQEVQVGGTGEWRGAAGQQARADAFYESKKNMGSDYNIEENQYNESQVGKEANALARIQANNLNVLGTNVLSALGNYSLRSAKGTNKDGSDLEIDGLPSTALDENTDLYLISTFPFAAEGTLIVNFNERRREKKPEKDGQESAFEYDADIFMKKDRTWVRIISQENSRALQETDVAGGKKLDDAVRHYFAEACADFAAKGTVDIAVEGLYKNYEYMNPSNIENSRKLGALLVLQPNTKWAGGAAKTVKDDVAVFGGSEIKSGLVYGGVYSFSDAELPRVTGTGNQPTFYNNYYRPSYELDEVDRVRGGKVMMGSATWLAIDNFRASFFVGGKAEKQGGLGGWDIRAKDANFSSFLNFDGNGGLTSGIVSIGGKTTKVSFLGANEMNASIVVAQREDKKQELNAISTFALKNGGKLTLAANLGPDVWKNNLTAMRMEEITKRFGDISNRMAIMAPETLLDIKSRKTTLSGIRDDVFSVINQAMIQSPAYDLHQSMPMNISIAYKDGKQDWVVTASVTSDKRLFATGLASFGKNKNFALIGGYLIGNKEDASTVKVFIEPDGSSRIIKTEIPSNYKWLAGTKIKVSKDLAFSAYIARTEDKKTIGNFDAAWREKASGAVAFGKDYFRVHTLIGNERISGMVNYVNLNSATGRLQSTEAGARLGLSTALFLTGAYAYTQMPGISNAFQGAAYDLASANGLVFEKAKYDSFKTEVYYKLGGNVTLSATAQMYRQRGKNNPYDFYAGVGFHYNIK